MNLSYPVGTVVISQEKVVGCQSNGVVRPCNAGMECIMHCLFGEVSAERALEMAEIYGYKIKQQ